MGKNGRCRIFKFHENNRLSHYRDYLKDIICSDFEVNFRDKGIECKFTNLGEKKVTK